MWRRVSRRALVGTFATALATVAGQPGPAVHAQPADEIPEPYPDGPNREAAFYFCTACHGFKVVAAQGMSRERWDDSLTWMTERHRMPKLEGQERGYVLDFLSAAFPERHQPDGWRNSFTQ